MKTILQVSMLNSTKIYIVDFEDSFTFNIASELYKFEKSIEVVSHIDFFSQDFFSELTAQKTIKFAIILGPGPGSPETYINYFDKIKILKLNKNIFLMGICLGHQIISMIQGFKIRSSNKPIHGNQIRLDFNNKNIIVQRYNSLAVYSADNSTDEIMVNKWDRGISYQFHPESIGTHNNLLFFKDLLNFIKSK
jgi:anthranilate/para-aminobenzoate synthase component II